MFHVFLNRKFRTFFRRTNINKRTLIKGYNKLSNESSSDSIRMIKRNEIRMKSDSNKNLISFLDKGKLAVLKGKEKQAFLT